LASPAPPTRPAPSARITEAKSLSATLPELLVEASRVVATVTAGWHGRRQAGPGETFWQFRPFATGESAARIDWRRSARDNELHVREREWENAETVWLHADLSASMRWRSHLATVLKRDRAAVLMLALADLLARAGERVGVPGLVAASPDRRAAERIAARLSHRDDHAALPDPTVVRRYAEVVVFSDLLDEPDILGRFAAAIAGAGARLHLVQVLDPAEESFPFTGRTEFVDPETGERIVAGRAEAWGPEYRALMRRQRDTLAELQRRAGGSFLVHHTDRPAGEALIALHGRLAAGDRFAARREAVE
jgi:uncharacterized protein (DUF58 family)